MSIPRIIEGGKYSDERGNLFFNNNFDASEIKRIYFIENKDIDFIRGWTGHQIEQRWFSAVQGSFIIRLLKIDNWDNPNKEVEILEFELKSQQLNVLHIPKGFATAVQAKDDGSKLMVMADYSLGEVKDEYRFEINYFEKLK
ncbi:WxcM-like domain-containing protein [Chryseobacterium sp. ERMR1:04]|uniref:WxcM-like domain-containing protein n=1 Tax=Chryseobacterium sp. ERMR1:04 TaxID=1705393 RepID=UPI0006C87C88|nr:WxcM-like domain-containing protein [Chryseobacterium sp. ERMR1:04]KPH13678.1 sugar epimerase [Chryseobacterium sp. ERMR1:04]